ncbi:MAG: hypothetical protein ACRDIA_02400, partial [Actinomycetota bacterium]
LSPLLGRKQYVRRDGDETADLVEAKEAVYRCILDLELDRKTGKVNPDQHDLMRRQLEAEAISILRRLDRRLSPDDLLELEIAEARRRLEQ